MSVKIANDPRVFLDAIPAEFAGPQYRAECQYADGPHAAIRFEILRTRAHNSQDAALRMRAIAALRHPAADRCGRIVLVAFSLE